MVFSRKTTTQAFSQQAAELGVAAPQVVRHRVRRMALAGAFPSARDQKEFKLMGQEKIDAFQESWQAMAIETILAQQKLGFSMLNSLLRGWPVGWNGAWAQPLAFPLQAATMGVLNKGMQPIHRRAMANAKRLNKI